MLKKKSEPYLNIQLNLIKTLVACKVGHINKLYLLMNGNFK